MLFDAIGGEHRQAKYRRDDAASIPIVPGTLIHNGKCGATLAIGSLSVALIQPSFHSFSMTEVGCSTLLSTGFGAAVFAAILLAMIATATDPENGVTLLPAAKPLAQNIFSVVSHSHLKARLDRRH